MNTNYKCAWYKSARSRCTPPYLLFVSFIIISPRNKMTDYSIGDRVEVRWEAELFDAAVIKVNPSGSVDVTYDIDGSGVYS